MNRLYRVWAMVTFDVRLLTFGSDKAAAFKRKQHCVPLALATSL